MAYSRDGRSENSQFSTTGLQHMRTVLSMQNTGTQPLLPPLCHPSSDRLNKTTPYTLEDHKRDVELRATFYKPEKVVITPVLPPPHPSKLAALLLKAEADTEDTSDERRDGQGKADSGKKLEKSVGEGHDSCSTTLKSIADSPSRLSCSSVTAETQFSKAESCPDSERKSPSVCRSDVSLDGSIHDSSLTSYQIPGGRHGHSTPVPVGMDGASLSEEGEESIKERAEPTREREGTPLSLTPVKVKKKATTPKPRPLLVHLYVLWYLCILCTI